MLTTLTNYNQYLFYFYGKLRYYYHTYVVTNDFTADHILDNIYIGNVYDAHNIQKLQEYNISNVISAVSGLDNIYDSSINHINLTLIDNSEQNIIQHFDTTNYFIDSIVSKNISTISNPKGILIHCICGVSRSVTILIAYMIYKYKYNPDTAIDFIKKRRNIANPNDNFKNQLWTYYNSLNK